MRQALRTPPSAAGDAPLPRTLAHFRLIARLGAGGHGTVYQAWDTRLERTVALKVLHDADGDGHAALREARHAARIAHPAFAQVYECVDTSEGPAIAMALLRGETLAAIVARGALPVDHALAIAREIALALDVAHERGVVHGDLKASNVMRTDRDETRILDLGLARRHDDRTQSGAADDARDGGGTLAYLAPERLLGHGATPAADIYALGVLLFELLDGVPPHAGLRGGALAHAILHGAVPTPVRDAVASRPGLAALIDALLQRDPSRRPASMRDVADRLARCRAEGGAGDAGATAPRTARTRATDPRRGADAAPARREAHAMRALAATFVVVLAVFVAVEWRRARDGAAADPEARDRAAIAAPVRGFAADLAIAESELRAFDQPGATARAIAALDRVLATQPGHAGASALRAIAYCLRFAGEGAQPRWLAMARDAATLALAGDDQLALAHAADGWARDFAGDDAAAERAYQRALALEPGNYFALQGYARLLTKQHRHHSAAVLLDDARRRYPKERVFLDALGTLRYQQADYVGAEHAFRDSLALQPDSPYAYANLNAALLRQGRADDAFAVLQEGLRIRPHARLYTNLGTALFAQARYAEAADAFERALTGPAGEPNDALKWANLGDALRQLPDRDDDARRAYRRALQLLVERLPQGDPDGTVRSRAALYAAKLGDATAARIWIARARDVEGGADFHFRLAVAAELVGDRASALRALRAAIHAGYPRRLVDSEPDLAALRADARYPDLLALETPR